MRIMQQRLERGENLFHMRDSQPDDRHHLPKIKASKAGEPLDDIYLDDDDLDDVA
jgi:hypothetical protein